METKSTVLATTLGFIDEGGSRFDTTITGHGGHDDGAELANDQKRDLIEYLTR